MLHFYAEHCEHALMYFFENKKIMKWIYAHCVNISLIQPKINIKFKISEYWLKVFFHYTWAVIDDLELQFKHFGIKNQQT